MLDKNGMEIKTGMVVEIIKLLKSTVLSLS